MLYDILQEFPWISTEQHLFGRPGTDYDWEATDPGKALAELNAAEETIGKLGKQVNKKVGTETPGAEYKADFWNLCQSSFLRRQTGNINLNVLL